MGDIVRDEVIVQILGGTEREEKGRGRGKEGGKKVELVCELEGRKGEREAHDLDPVNLKVVGRATLSLAMNAGQSSSEIIFWACGAGG